jgi:hypothetical protein
MKFYLTILGNMILICLGSFVGRGTTDYFMGKFSVVLLILGVLVVVVELLLDFAVV